MRYAPLRKLIMFMICAALCFSAVDFCAFGPETVYGAKVYYSEEEIVSYLKDVMADRGNTEAVFNTDFSLSKSDIVRMVREAAVANKRAMTVASPSYSYRGSYGSYEYRVDLLPQFFTDVVVLESEKSAYSHALKALKGRDYTTVFYSDKNMYYDIFLRTVEQHPEYNYNISIWKSTAGTCGYRLSDDADASEVKRMMKAADKKAARVVSSIISDGMSTGEKYREIHDYLVRNCVYDMETYDNAGSSWGETYTAYGCLIDKYAVCQGYAAAFNLLCAKAGLLSMSVSGTAKGGPHAWNMVKLGDEYRYLDVTWDDPVPDRGDKVSYDYFLLTADEMSQSHKWLKTKYAVKYLKYSKYGF